MFDWQWKGIPGLMVQLRAIVESFTPLLLHEIQGIITLTSGRLAVADERIDHVQSSLMPDQQSVCRLQGEFYSVLGHDGALRRFPQQDLFESILSQLKDPEQYPELMSLSLAYTGIRLYREWPFGRSSVFRAPQPADLPSDSLEEDFSNLGLFLNHLRGNPKVKSTIIEHLRGLYVGIDDFDVRVKGGGVELFLTEGDFVVPARRLSDGTLRYLCLLAILCDPEPPPLICIEEPELGLHPDMLPKLADLLVEASSRTQLVVTTHSDILVDAMTERPECVVVFEKRDGQTHMHRLDRDELKQWLDQYRLGQLWTSGQIGGTRW
jgi:predicted ATPase